MGFINLVYNAIAGFLSGVVDLRQLGVTPEAVALALLFGAVVLTVLAVGSLINAVDPMKRRLRRDAGDAGLSAEPQASLRYAGGPSFLERLVKPIQGALLPSEARERSTLRRQLAQAGYMGPSAVGTFYALRLIMAVALPLIFAAMLPLLSRSMDANRILITAATLLGLGFYLPVLFVHSRIRQRSTVMRNGFPDALDMLLVCVEAGLGLDGAIARVGQELKKSNALLGEQFDLVSLAMRAGKSREDALKSFADRVSIDEISSFVNLLNQSTSLGTSVGDALRVYASEMRTKRLQRAEEKAHKLPVKMSIPLVLFMLPTLMIVILLPAIIQIIRVLLTA
ncbi:MAG TPA: type II secretion system F family protein [Azospirillaceae bacterium]|nr:type II secretion system F family protein [Azospirillaceae bacterium]